MRVFIVLFAFVLLIFFSIMGFRGMETSREPIEIFPDMERQPRYQPQGESEFFADGRADREPVAGTVARGNLRDDPHRYAGQDGEGAFADGFPGIVDRETMKRGQERYQIYCGVCHGATGDGQGVTAQYGMGAVPTFHSERLRDMPEGEIFEVITNGRGLMESYADKVPVDDRWAIIAYVRALQRAHLGAAEDVPADRREELGL